MIVPKEIKNTTLCRNLCFTLNNYTDEEESFLQNNEFFKYIIYGKEIGESGTPHLQGYVEFTTRIRFNTIHQWNVRIHWEHRISTAENAATYCKKGEQSKEEWNIHHSNGPNFGKNAIIFEKGIRSSQGKRNDLVTLKNEILSGKKTVEQIAEENTSAFHQYGRTLKELEIIRFKKNRRNTMTKGFWYFGKSGIGKSYDAFHNFGTYYTWSKTSSRDNPFGFQCAYQQEPTVVINEFRGGLPYDCLLELVDEHPLTIPIKNKTALHFNSQNVVVTSALPPWEIYKNRHKEDSLDQFARRFVIYTRNSRFDPWLEVKIPASSSDSVEFKDFK